MKKHLFLTILIAIVAIPVAAQDHGPPAGGSDKNLRDSSSDVKGRSNEMERVRRDIDKSEAAAPESPAGFSQIKEDFERIQIINGDVLQAPPTNGTLTYDRLSEGAAEMEKRAVRLKTNLFGAKSAKQTKDKKPGAETQELKALLAALDKAILDFTHSPIFQNTGVVTPDDSANAQKELDKIIQLSAGIKLEADRMKKVNAPSQ